MTAIHTLRDTSIALGHDLRDAARRLLRHPRNSLLVICLLALGQGLGVTFFALLDDVVLAPLPYDEPDRLVHLWGVAESFGIDTYPYSWDGFLDYRRDATEVSDLAATRSASFTVDVDGIPRSVAGGRVTPNLLGLLGVQPILGRDFQVDADLVDLGAGRQADAALVSHGFWQRHLGGRSDVIGSTLRIDGDPYRVEGVLPPSFRYPDRDTQILTTLRVAGDETVRGFHFLRVTGRLAEGRSLAEAETELQAIAARLAADYPKDHGELTLRLISLRDQVVDQGAVRGLEGLLAGAHVLFLAACINVSILLLVRTLARREEIALRSMLGAGSGAIARRLSIENLLLVALGCALGTGLAVVSIGYIGSLDSDLLPRAHEITADAGTLTYAFVLFLVAAGLFALLPIPQALALIRRSRGQGSPRATAGAGARRVQGLLIAGQMGLALVLSFVALMFAGSLGRLAAVDMGFESEAILAGGLELPPASFATREDQIRVIERVLAQVRELPGVVSAGYFSRLPLTPADASIVVFLPGQDAQPGSPNASYRVATPGWRQAMGVPLLAGRDLAEQDDSEEGRRSVMVDQTLAERLWPGRSAVGQTLHIGDQGAWTVVGVIGAMRLKRPDQEPNYTVYVTPGKNPFLISMSRPWVFLRAHGDPVALRQPLHDILRAAAPGQAVLGVQTWDEIAGEWLRERRLISVLLLVFGGTSVLLAAAGLFAVVSFTVEQRKVDFAIRAALGASPRRVAGRVLADGMRPVLFGAVTGVAVAAFVGLRLAPQLYDTEPLDPGSVIATVLVLLVAVGLAILPGALRAGGHDPAGVLRPFTRQR